MMTVDEFNTAAARRAGRTAGWIAGGFVQLLGVAALFSLAKENRLELLLSPVAAPLVAAGVMVASFFAFLTCLWQASRADRRDAALRCPYCGHGLGTGVHRLIVVATRNCTTCGRRVLAEPADTPAADDQSDRMAEGGSP